MYKCLNCGAEFETPAKDSIDCGDGYSQIVVICPECRIDDIEKLKPCSMCREHYIKSSKDCCANCELAVSRWMEYAMRWISEETSAERDDIIQAMVHWVENL